MSLQSRGSEENRKNDVFLSAGFPEEPVLFKHSEDGLVMVTLASE